jgi:hypothetical protein
MTYNNRNRGYGGRWSLGGIVLVIVVVVLVLVLLGG